MKYLSFVFIPIFMVVFAPAIVLASPAPTWQDPAVEEQAETEADADAEDVEDAEDVDAEDSEDADAEEPSKDADEKNAIDLKAELGVLGSVYKRRMALLWLKHLQDEDKLDSMFPKTPDDVVSKIRSVVASESNYKQLAYHYVERARNAEVRILQKLRQDKFEGVQDLLESMEQKSFPASVAYANLMNVLELNFIYSRRKGIVDDEEFIKEVSEKLSSETTRIQGTAGHSDKEVAKAMYEDPGSIPVRWFHQDRKDQTFPFGAIPVVADFPLIDLNKATAEELQEIPRLSQEFAEAILEYRKKRGSLEGPEQLRLIKALPKHLVSAFQSLTMASDEITKKKWTVMVFLNGANNLEPFAIDDMNEMEKFGSTDDVNVIVEIARMEHGDKDKSSGEKPNPSYFSNPYRERGTPQFYFGVGNTPGVERYYVLKDEDDMRVQSVIKERIADVDHGSSEALANFGKWATENYPAEHYALMVWNHGSGWTGISYDDNTHHGMDLPEVREALEAICEQLKEKQGKEKIDIVDFDACLMATYEVAFELCDTVDYLVASQETEPGEGLPYDDVLKWLTMYPEASPVSFCKNLVDCYVRSYGPGGSQTYNGRSGYSETLSAIRLANIPKMRDALDEFAQLLEKRPKLIGETADEIISETRRFSGRLVDIQDLCYRFYKNSPEDKELKAVYEKIKDLIAYPEDDYKLVNEVIVKRRTPGNVIWGYNGWKSPPKNMAPFQEDYKLAKIPLVGPDEKGYYVAKIKFPPVIYPGSGGGFFFMNASRQDGKVEKADDDDGDDQDKGPQVVKEINYRFEGDSKEHTFKDFENMFITTNFPESSILVAEGHLMNQNNSHGLTIYFPSYLGYNKEYRRLRFAKDSAWVRLCEKFPLKSLEEAKPIGLLGMSHLNKPTQKELGKLVVREEYEKRMRELNFDQNYRDDLESMEKEFSSIKEPKRYGEDWHGVLENFVDGVVLLDRLDGSRSPSSRSVMRYLQQGGRTMIMSPGINRTIWDMPLYRDTLGLQYDQVWDNSFEFEVSGAKEADTDEGAADEDSDESKASDGYEIVKSSEGASIMTFQVAEGEEGVEPWLILPDSGKMIGAKISRKDPKTGKSFKAVVLGFYLNDVTDEGKRRALLKDAMEFLESDRN